MVVLGLTFVALMTLALPHAFVNLADDGTMTAIDGSGRLTPLERFTILSRTAAFGLAVLAVPFWAEFFARALWIERGPVHICGVPRADRRRALHLLACALVPPLRVGLPPATMPARTWLPGVGWRVASRPLSRRVQKAFGVPMLGIGLLILPVLAAEVALADLVRSHEGFAVGLDVATRLIWLAFALEFVVMLAVTPRKLEYATRHWVDLVIILLPFAAFLRSLQVVRAGQLLKAQQMSKLASTYRLRGLAVKLLQAVLLLRVLESLNAGIAKRRIERVAETIRRRREEVGELEAELRDLRADLAARLREKRAKRLASAATPALPAPPADDPPATDARGGSRGYVVSR